MALSSLKAPRFPAALIPPASCRRSGRSRRLSLPLVAAIAAAGLAATIGPALGNELEERLGLNDTRVYAAPLVIEEGQSVERLGLDARLERLGYERVSERPTRPGTWFHGYTSYWVYRRQTHAFGRDHDAELFGLALERASRRVLGLRDEEGEGIRPIRSERDAWLEPELLSESLEGRRARRVRTELDEMPEHLWRAVLAAEDARFFDHAGVDGRAIARAALANIREGGVAQGGSTITQQLIKNRDLSPRRTLGRKVSEAIRALALEAEYDKEEILEAYLDEVYLGHREGLAIHGVGTAARAYFGRDWRELPLHEAASLAAMIQGPNRLSPIDDGEALRERRDWVLGRLEELGWASADAVARAKRQPVRARPRSPERVGHVHLLGWLAELIEEEEPRRYERGRGFLVQTTIDPLLQRHAEGVVADELARLRRGYPLLRNAGLSAALVALDARTGAVLAYVGGDPGEAAGGFDRARQARRQPGSVVKPFVVLEAIEDCGRESPLTASTRIVDRPLTIERGGGDWSPGNFDDRYAGVVLLRESLAASRNVPAVRIARHCGFDDVARMFRRAGLSLPDDPTPAFVLGAVETTPLRVAAAYTVFATPGDRLEPFLIRRLESARGRNLERGRPDDDRVVRGSSAYIVRDLLTSAVEYGTARGGKIRGVEVAAKTGSSSELRDAWFAGHAGSVVTAVWVGLDGGGRLGLTGAEAAGPIWRAFMEEAVALRPAYEPERPGNLVERWVEVKSGRLVPEARRGARRELYRWGTLPPKRYWLIRKPIPPIE